MYDALLATPPVSEGDGERGWCGWRGVARGAPYTIVAWKEVNVAVTPL